MGINVILLGVQLWDGLAPLSGRSRNTYSQLFHSMETETSCDHLGWWFLCDFAFALLIRENNEMLIVWGRIEVLV